MKSLLKFLILLICVPIFAIGAMVLMFVVSVVLLFMLTATILSAIMAALFAPRDGHIHNWENKALGLAQCSGDNGCGDIKEIA